MGRVLSLKRGPRRVKHSVVPPDSCYGCLWRRKYNKLLKDHKAIRLELLKLVNEQRERRQELDSDAEEASPPDLYEVMSRDD